MPHNDYSIAFKDAERHLKNAENIIYGQEPTGEVEFLRGLLFPVVNELRYAGHHAIRAVESLSEDERDECWKEAKKHCFRASYDAFDAQIQYFISECDLFQRDFRRVPIGPIINGYQDDCQTLNRIKMIDYQRSGNREDHWEEMEKHVETLKPILEKWNTGRDELNKSLKKELFERWLKALGLIGVIMGIVVGLMKLF